MNRERMIGSNFLNLSHFMDLQAELKVHIKGMSLPSVEQGLSETAKESHFSIFNTLTG
jgi:hypothetical protein